MQCVAVELDTKDAWVRAPTDSEFRRFQILIERETGIHLSESKKALLAGRLNRRLRELGLRDFSAYYRVVAGDNASERVRMIDRVCTNETRFFREPRQFELLRERILPQWVARAARGERGRRLRAWCAACSTGEEPYSLAMALLDALQARLGWDIDILATDLSTSALDCATAGAYPIEKASEIPPPYLKRYMLRGARSREGWMKVGPAVRAVVRFARLNLNDASYPIDASFDLIFCRNTLIYFSTATKRRVIDRLLDLTAPGGYLFLGHAESVTGLSERVRHVGDTVYTRLDSPPALGASFEAARSSGIGVARPGTEQTLRRSGASVAPPEATPLKREVKP
ncbi:MAG: protein-glutamate O-methyltransferase CheR [Vicinamibacteria bacterium]|nr:protein-glutamate O-methyltransferase CheR [Vicinamibacteria bacterium]